MSPYCKIIFEPHNIDNASPATVSRNGMVYMSSSGLDWKPSKIESNFIVSFSSLFFLVLSAWLKGRTNREKQVFSELFDQSFLGIFTWSTQNCEFMMEILQCNIIQQMIFILEGLVTYSKDVEQTEKIKKI